MADDDDMMTATGTRPSLSLPGTPHHVTQQAIYYVAIYMSGAGHHASHHQPLPPSMAVLAGCLPPSAPRRFISFFVRSIEASHAPRSLLTS